MLWLPSPAHFVRAVLTWYIQNTHWENTTFCAFLPLPFPSTVPLPAVLRSLCSDRIFLNVKTLLRALQSCFLAITLEKWTETKTLQKSIQAFKKGPEGWYSSQAELPEVFLCCCWKSGQFTGLESRGWISPSIWKKRNIKSLWMKGGKTSLKTWDQCCWLTCQTVT